MADIQEPHWLIFMIKQLIGDIQVALIIMALMVGCLKKFMVLL